MCYRYSVPGPDAVKKTFQVKIGEDFQRRYHVGAFENVKLPVITNQDPHQVQLFKWGLIPFWVKDEKTASEFKDRTVNARSETIFDKPAFRSSAGKQHCLVIADGFFEWRYYNGKNYPYYIKLKDREVFSIAGLWDRWVNKNSGEEIYSYTIITTEANPLMAMIHNKKKRMPAILDKKDEEKWIKKTITKEETMDLLKPYDESNMTTYTISKMITAKDIDVNVPEVLEPFQYNNLEPLPSKKSLF
ncbi:MAG: SOS response-associated peptidase [Candidatus Thermoplasmatota archaeon]|nr:SOS response-associated peptidase [Candidatus Thermoplasmatota archaeon]